MGCRSVYDSGPVHTAKLHEFLYNGKQCGLRPPPNQPHNEIVITGGGLRTTPPHTIYLPHKMINNVSVQTNSTHIGPLNHANLIILKCTKTKQTTVTLNDKLCTLLYKFVKYNHHNHTQYNDIVFPCGGGFKSDFIPINMQ